MAVETRWVRSRGWGLAGLLAVAAIAAVGVQGAIGAPADKAKARDSRREEAKKQAAPAVTKAETATTGMVTRSVGGVQVSIDPATGRIQQPTASEAQALAAALGVMLSRESDGLPVTQMPDGTVMVDLQDTFQEVAIATKARGGKVEMQCVNDAATARRLLGLDEAAAAKPAKPGAEKRAAGRSTAEKE